MMNLIKCDPQVRAKCPYKVPCCKDDEANYFEGSDCDKFAQKVLAAPMTNGDRLRAMTDKELADFLCGVYEEEEIAGKFICGTIIPDYNEDVICEWLKQPCEVEK